MVEIASMLISINLLQFNKVGNCGNSILFSLNYCFLGKKNSGKLR